MRCVHEIGVFGEKSGKYGFGTRTKFVKYRFQLSAVSRSHTSLYFYGKFHLLQLGDYFHCCLSFSIIFSELAIFFFLFLSKNHDFVLTVHAQFVHIFPIID